MEKPLMDYLPLCWAACLHCVSAIWAIPYKGVSVILFQTIGLRLSLSNQSCTAPANQNSCIPTSQDSAFWTNQTAKIWSLIWMRTDQSETKGRDTCAYKLASPLAQGAHVPFLLKTENWKLCLPGRAETLKMPWQSRADQHRQIRLACSRPNHQAEPSS